MRMKVHKLLSMLFAAIVYCSAASTAPNGN